MPEDLKYLIGTDTGQHSDLLLLLQLSGSAYAIQPQPTHHWLWIPDTCCLYTSPCRRSSCSPAPGLVCPQSFHTAPPSRPQWPCISWCAAGLPLQKTLLPEGPDLFLHLCCPLLFQILLPPELGHNFRFHRTSIPRPELNFRPAFPYNVCHLLQSFLRIRYCSVLQLCCYLPLY